MIESSLPSRSPVHQTLLIQSRPQGSHQVVCLAQLAFAFPHKSFFIFHKHRCTSVFLRTHLIGLLYATSKRNWRAFIKSTSLHSTSTCLPYSTTDLHLTKCRRWFLNLAADCALNLVLVCHLVKSEKKKKGLGVTGTNSCYVYSLINPVSPF